MSFCHVTAVSLNKYTIILLLGPVFAVAREQYFFKFSKKNCKKSPSPVCAHACFGQNEAEKKKC